MKVLLIGSLYQGYLYSLKIHSFSLHNIFVYVIILFCQITMLFRTCAYSALADLYTVKIHNTRLLSLNKHYCVLLRVPSQGSSTAHTLLSSAIQAQNY